MADQIESIFIEGFDPDGDVEIRRMDDGSLWLVVDPVPPEWLWERGFYGMNLGPCADFDKQLERAIGVPVHWDDREFFYIQQPREDTIAAIRQFLVDFRRTHDTDENGV
ncbi:hypothetical protein ACFL5Q_05485 [Planctomycetota bacterium]